jgi:5-formyltetrahydrofolate cyclo-ligase
MIDRDFSHIKNMLRVKARARRKTFNRSLGGASWSLPWGHHLDAHLDRGVPLASYRAIDSEADPTPIDRLAFHAQAFTGYPRFDTDGMMRFYTPGPSQAFRRNSMGFEEPAADGWPITPVLVLVPLLAFDRHGTRLGQGGGHYDRALAMAERAAAAEGSPLTKIGIAWSVQEMEDLPREPWDIPLDIVITEREWIVTS